MYAIYQTVCGIHWYYSPAMPLAECEAQLDRMTDFGPQPLTRIVPYHADLDQM